MSGTPISSCQRQLFCHLIVNMCLCFFPESLPSPKQSKAASQAKHVQDVKGVFKTIEEATVKGALS